MDKFKIILPNKKEYIISARLAASSIANISGFDIEKVEDIRLAVGEACNNAVIHGSSSENINIELFCDEDKIVIMIKDSGSGFIPGNIEKVDLEYYDGSGLGLFIIQSLMDEVYLDSNDDQGTTIKMIKMK